MAPIIIAALLLLIGSTLVSFQVASRRLPRLERPFGAKPVPAIVSLATYLVFLLAAVTLLWHRYGWPSGIGTIIAGVWVLPPWFESLWLKRFRRQTRAIGREPRY